jgi:(2Fe-2S) ferredoxin
VSEPRYRVVVCRGPECGEKRGSALLYAELERLVRARGLAPRVELEWQSCFGRCQSGPNVLVRVVNAADNGPRRFSVLLPTTGGDSVLYNAVRLEEIAQILEHHILGGRPIRAMLNRKPKEPKGIAS